MKAWTNTKTLDEYLKIESCHKNEAEYILLGSKPINLRDFPKVRGIYRVGVGDENVPYDLANEMGVEVRLPSIKARQYIWEETANFTCYLIFQQLYREIGNIKTWEKYPRESLQNKKLLVVGRGNIGQRVVDKMSHFVKVNCIDAIDKNFEKDLELHMRDSDVITLHIPGGEKTRSFIDAIKLSWIKDKASLINTARGSIVEHDALENEIKTGRIFASFDVFWEEPYNGSLIEYENFYMTPHVAATNVNFLEQCALEFMEFAG